MSRKNYIIVGAKPPKDSNQHAGGVLTRSVGLVDYAHRNGDTVYVIDTLINAFDMPSIFKRTMLGIGRVLEIIRVLRSDHYDGVIAFGSFPSAWTSFVERLLLCLTARAFRVPCVFACTGGDYLEKDKLSPVLHVTIRTLLMIPSKVAVQGNKSATFCIRCGVNEDRITCVPNWLPNQIKIATNPKDKESQQKLRFIFVGWIIREKGINEIFDAISILLNQYSFTFTFIGGGTLLDDAKKRIQNEGWSDHVLTMGWQPKETVYKALEGADVFVLPSYTEGFPNALVEAMAKGLPAICSNVGSIADSLKDGVNGYLIPPKQTAPLVTAMQKYLDEPELVNKHSKNSLKIVRENHDYESNCKRFFDAFS